MKVYYAKEDQNLDVKNAIIALQNDDVKRIDIPEKQFFSWCKKEFGTTEEQEIERKLIVENIILLAAHGLEKVVLIRI